MLIEGLYTIDELNSTNTEISAKITLNAKHEIFKGHFPGNPIMPGVCMMQIIKELTEKVLNNELILQTSTNIKFMAKINPEINPDLTINISHREEEGILKIKNSCYFDNTLALKLNANYIVKS